MAQVAPTTPQRLAAEFLGTFVLVFGGCGSAVLAATFLSGGVQLGIGHLGVALAFGLTVLTMAYAFGHVSGGHFNPAVTLGLAAGRRFAWKDTIGYVVTQVVAAIAAAAVLYVVASGKDGFSAKASGFATNGYGDRSPGGYDLLACFVIEVVLTAVFLYVILGVVDTRAPKGFAPIAIGLALTLDPSGVDPGHEHVGEPGALHRSGPLRGVGRDQPALALHPRADPRSAHRRVLVRAPRRRGRAGGPAGGGHRRLSAELVRRTALRAEFSRLPVSMRLVRCYTPPSCGHLTAFFLTDEDLHRQAGRDPARLVRRRRRGEDPGPPRDADRRHPARQAEAAVHAARRHGRLRHRRQCGEDPRHRAEARPEDGLPALRVPRRPEDADVARAARPPADRGHPQGGQGHAAEEQARRGAADQAQGLRRPRASSRRAGAEDPGEGVGQA